MYDSLVCTCTVECVHVLYGVYQVATPNHSIHSVHIPYIHVCTCTVACVHVLYGVYTK